MSHLLSDQAIPIIHDRLESWPAENCCFCRNATHWWTSLRDRTPGQQVACCQACAKSRAASEVPSKTAWCDAEKTTEGRRRADQSKPDDQRCFYVLDARSPVGNCALWWRPERSGYTTELGEAGLYTEAETKRMRCTDIPFHRDIVLLHLDHVEPTVGVRVMRTMKTITITITEIPDEWPGATGKPGSHPSTESEDLIERITANVREVLAASMRSDFRDGCQFPGMRYKVSAGGKTRG